MKQVCRKKSEPLSCCKHYLEVVSIRRMAATVAVSVTIHCDEARMLRDGKYKLNLIGMQFFFSNALRT